VSSKLLAVFTTVASREQARKIASALVERRLVACAQISEIESFYRWRGSVQHEPEFRLLLKTTQARYAEVEAALRELHSYELPAIHAVAVENAYGPYAAWVEEASCGAS
jgi:periplasmic divalent cation tolerance protein